MDEEVSEEEKLLRKLEYFGCGYYRLPGNGVQPIYHGPQFKELAIRALEKAKSQRQQPNKDKE